MRCSGLALIVCAHARQQCTQDTRSSKPRGGRWPDGKGRGLSPACIVPYLQRGMMRPGMPELLAHLQLIGATIVVYTHSEDRWAVKVCQAMERLAGWPFIHRVFSRMGLGPAYSFCCSSWSILILS